MLQRWLPVLALWAALAAVYSPAATADFVNWDDTRFVVDNPLIEQGLRAYTVAAWTEVQFQAYQPLHLLSYLPDLLLWPTSPAGFHLVNLVLFAAMVGLLYHLARRFVDPLPALLACALVSLHPICVEPVAWITSRKDLVSGVLFFLALTIDDRRWTQDASERPYWRCAWPGLVLFTCALLAKSSTVCYPLVLFAWLRWLRGVSWRRAAVVVLPHAALATAAAIAVATFWSSSQLIGQTRPVHPVLDVPASYAVYLRHLVWPVDLSALYHPESSFHTAAGVVVLVAALALVAAWRRLPGAARFAAFAPAAALAPVVNIVPMYFRYADRYTFLAWTVATIPIALGLHALLELLSDDRGGRTPARLALVAGLGLLALVLAGLGHGQSRVWRDSQTLWRNAARLQPDSYFVRLKYGETLRDAGQWQPAVAEYQSAIRLQPETSLAYAGLFYLYARQSPEIDDDTADRWLSVLGAAVRSPRDLRQFRSRVASGGCLRCDRILLLLELRRWPPGDEQLQAAARRALESGQRDIALIHLSEVRDQDSEGFRTLWQAAQPPGAR